MGTPGSMEGYDVITSDDRKAGYVIADRGEDIDEGAVARHYGLAAGDPAPETQGYGELLPDDPARSSEEEALRTGVEPVPEVRARIRSGRDEPGLHGRQIIPADPHEGP